MRSCAGCRGRAPQAELARFAARDGLVVPDPGRRLDGRGAWLHADPACLELAMRGHGFARALRAGVAVPAETLEWIQEWQRNASRT